MSAAAAPSWFTFSGRIPRRLAGYRGRDRPRPRPGASSTSPVSLRPPRSAKHTPLPPQRATALRPHSATHVTALPNSPTCRNVPTPKTQNAVNCTPDASLGRSCRWDVLSRPVTPPGRPDLMLPSTARTGVLRPLEWLPPGGGQRWVTTPDRGMVLVSRDACASPPPRSVSSAGGRRVCRDRHPQGHPRGRRDRRRGPAAGQLPGAQHRAWFHRLGGAVRRPRVRRIGIEGSGNFGRAVAVHLAVAWSHDPTVEVVEVPTLMTSRERRGQVGKGKTDPVDALAIARITAREPEPAAGAADRRARPRTCVPCWTTATTWSPSAPPWPTGSTPT